MSVVSLTTVGQAANKTAPYSLASITGNVYDLGGTSYTIPDTKSLVFFRGKTFTPPYEYIVTTLVGSGTPAFADGTGAGASFNSPSDVAIDSIGNVIVVDTNNHRIRKVTSGAAVTTLAGDGYKVSYSPYWGRWLDGSAAGASFNFPYGVAIDSGGNVIVADYYNSRIRKITPGGSVTTLAGNGAWAAFSDGTGTGASFHLPCGVAIDSSDNIIVVDSGNNRIRKVTNPGGVVTTLAGSATAAFADGTGAGASFSNPIGVAIDSSGNIIVADYYNSRIRKVTNPGGVVTTLAGDGYTDVNGLGRWVDGTGAGASFNFPSGVAIDSSGNIIVTDTYNNRIRKVTNPGGVVTTLAGSGTADFAEGTGTGASFNGPGGVAIDSGGNIIVADKGNHRIRKIRVVNSPPSAPENVQLAYTPGATSISVSWNSVLQATSYTVNFYVSGNSTPVQIFTSVISLSQASSFSLVTNTTYYASVSANNSLASSAFQQSNNITTAPSSPTGVTMGAYSSGATSISVSWNSVSGATSYTVNFYASGNATPVQTFASVTSLTKASSFTLVANTTYYASVSANNATTSSAFQQSSNNITTVAAENPIIFTTDGTPAVNTSTSGFYITSTPNKSTVSLQETLTFTAYNIPYQPGSPYAWFLNTTSGNSIASNTNPINYQFTSMGNHKIVASVNSFPINGRSNNLSINDLSFTVISLYNNSKTFESTGNPTIKLTNANSNPIWINVSGPQNLGITINSTQFTITSSGQISIYISNPSSVNTVIITGNSTSTQITVTITNSSQYSSTATY